MLAVTLGVAVFVALAVSLPLAVSSDVVRDRLERDIGAWAGHPVSLGGAPSLDFWPLPTIRLDDVAIQPSAYPEGDPLMRADSIIANFNLFSAVLGAPSFSEFRLVRPTFAVSLFPDGTTNWKSTDGALARGIAAARQMDTAEQSGEQLPDALSVPENAAIGTVTIEDGTIEWVSDPAAGPGQITAINGSIAWPSPTATARLSVTAIFGGEQITVSAQTPEPLLLLGRREAPIDLSVNSAPLSFDFKGKASLEEEFFYDGAFRFASKSLRRVLEWSGTDIRPGTAIGAIDLTADLSGGSNRAKLDDLVILIDANRGIGVLDLERSEGQPPSISGTLAFNRFDIASFLKAFTPLPTSGQEIASTIDTRFLRELRLDLRLSAQSAVFGSIALSNLAAAARIADGRAHFDIGDANLYDGSMIGRIAISENGIDGGAKLQISTRETDLARLFDALGVSGPLPRGSGAIVMELTSPFPTWATAATDLTGRITLAVNNGIVQGLDLARLRKLAEEERFFAFRRIGADTAFAFQSADFDLQIASGQAEITRGEVRGERAGGNHAW